MTVSRHAPTWADFDESPGAAINRRSPLTELASLLRRHRSDLDAAARAGAESRIGGLRSLAEQAVLAIELEKLLQRRSPDPAGRVGSPVDAALWALKDRMLAQIAASGLEVIRLSGASARAVTDIVEVVGWRFDDAYTSEVVAEELEVAVRLDGAPLRMGRVVIGAPRRSVGPAATASAPPAQPPRGRAAQDGHATARPAAPTITCPVEGCGVENDLTAEVCVGCLAELRGYTRLWMHPRALFNCGLQAARSGDSATARECFAAVVLWHPEHMTSRNAYGLACLDVGDARAARRAWEEVLARSPQDPVAASGLAALARTIDGARAKPAPDR